MRRVAVAIFKGGTGKSTVAVNAAVGLARRGRRVLLVDLDSQASATQMLGAAEARPTIREVLVDHLAPEQAVRPVEANLEILPSSRALAPIEAWLATQVRHQRHRAGAALAVAAGALRGEALAVAGRRALGRRRRGRAQHDGQHECRGRRRERRDPHLPA